MGFCGSVQIGGAALIRRDDQNPIGCNGSDVALSQGRLWTRSVPNLSDLPATPLGTVIRGARLRAELGGQRRPGVVAFGQR
jgi:hypothetical protein